LCAAGRSVVISPLTRAAWTSSTTDRMPPDAASLNLAQLAEHCAAETRRFYNNEPHNPAFCFELLRRGFVNRDQIAWDLVYAQYKAQILRWVLHHPHFPATGDEAEDLMQSVFVRLLGVMTPEKFAQFPTLAALLRYVQMTVNSVIMDVTRKRPARKPGDIDDDATEISAPEAPLSPIEKDELWRLIVSRLKGEGDLLLIRASFIWDMKPAEIHQTWPQVFTDVNEVYRMKQNILDRLSRVPELAWFLNGTGK
jgi:DNA-directed RNA polymerase specialized sigma24 family protein